MQPFCFGRLARRRGLLFKDGSWVFFWQTVCIVSCGCSAPCCEDLYTFPEVLARLAYSPDTALCMLIGVYDQAFHFLPLPIPFIVGVRRHICVIVLLTKWTIFERKKPISHERWEQKQVLCLNFCTKYIKSLLKS